jgi:hypothetical protein
MATDAPETDLKPCDLAALETFEFERVLSQSEWTALKTSHRADTDNRHADWLGVPPGQDPR